jgi:hypothetical protein
MNSEASQTENTAASGAKASTAAASASAGAKRKTSASHALIHLGGLSIVLATLIVLAVTGRLDSGEATALLTLAGGFLGAGGASLGALSNGSSAP